MIDTIFDGETHLKMKVPSSQVEVKVFQTL